MKRLLRFLIIVVAIGFWLFGAAVVYARPDSSLDLKYRELSSTDKIADMIRSFNLSVELSNDDLNQLLKKLIAQHPNPEQHIEIVGARFSPRGDRLDADLNMRLYGKLPIGLHLTYRVKTEGSQITAVCEAAQIRRIQLPLEWIEPRSVTVDLNGLLPKVVAVRELTLKDDGLRVDLKLR